jgi:hypothetical protein
MRGIALLAAAAAVAGALSAARTAAADVMDPALSRLVTQSPGCRTSGPTGTGVYYNPASGYVGCTPDNVAFAQLVAQYAAAIAPTGMHSARTTGFGGFEFWVEGALTTIDNSASYWKNGTQGSQDPVSKNFSTSNPSPPPLLQLYSAHIRKGLPFGFELAADVGYLAQSSISTLGGDVRWSIFEGFRRGIPALFPEVAAVGAVRTITGVSDQFQLTVVAVSGEISKPFPITGTSILTPTLGYQFLRVFGDSAQISLTPNTDPVSYCGYAGPNLPGTPGATAPYNGQPVCTHGTSADFNNIVTFNPVRMNRHRILAGLGLRVQMISLTGEFVYDLVSPGDANQVPAGQLNPFQGMPSQMTLAFDLGVVF